MVIFFEITIVQVYTYFQVEVRLVNSNIMRFTGECLSYLYYNLVVFGCYWADLVPRLNWFIAQF